MAKLNRIEYLRNGVKVSKNPALVGIGNFKKSAPVVIEKFAKEEAQKLAADIRKVIYRQLYNWVPLATGTAKAKEALGLDPRILIATGAYVKNIKARPRVGRGGCSAVWVVGNSDRLHPGDTFTYKELSRWLEFGTKRSGQVVIPARPHFRPVWARFVVSVNDQHRALTASLVDILQGKKK